MGELTNTGKTYPLTLEEACVMLLADLEATPDASFTDPGHASRRLARHLADLTSTLRYYVP